MFDNEARLKSLEDAITAINETIYEIIKQSGQIVDIIAEQNAKIEMLKSEMNELLKESGSQ